MEESVRLPPIIDLRQLAIANTGSSAQEVHASAEVFEETDWNRLTTNRPLLLAKAMAAKSRWTTAQLLSNRRSIIEDCHCEDDVSNRNFDGAVNLIK